MSRETRVTLRTVIVCAAIVAGTFALFSRSVGYGFINYDDPLFVVNNPRVQGGLSWAGVRWAFVVDRDFWHPLTWISLMADRELFGDNASGYRLVNIGWHALNALLVLAIVRRMTGMFWIAAVSAVLFAWHPQRVESVVWITERKDVLSGFFALATVWAWLRYGRARESEGARGWAWYGVALAAFACALMSKSVVVTLPVVLLLLDLWPLGRFRPGPAGWRTAGRLVAEKLPFFAASLAVGLFTVATQDAGGAFTLPLTLDQRVANAFVSTVRYLGQTVWPFGLAVLYPHPGHWSVVLVGGAGLVVAGVSVAAWLYRGERPAWLVGWGWFVAFLLPTLGLIQVGLQA
ncbi:MAG: phospholipid carrier-dependent glycosyltransferase, partial [Pedosphaera parvula]|nr:phospholipid carrier-dependent glycosyltransferase [Pedosphaera parvula]